MSEVLWWLTTVIGPVLLLVALVWLVFRKPSNRTTRETEQGTRDEYAEEEALRRKGTDDL